MLGFALFHELFFNSFRILGLNFLFIFHNLFGLNPFFFINLNIDFYIEMPLIKLIFTLRIIFQVKYNLI